VASAAPAGHVVHSDAMLDLALLAPEKARRLKRSEFLELERLGAFDDERVELLYGVIVEMTSGGPPHASPIQELTQLLVPKLLGRATVRIQLDYLAEFESVPVPDLAVVPLAKYRDAHPERAHCVIEVASSSLRKDRLIKAPLYAASGVGEYWIVDVNERSILVFRDSDGTVYRSETRYGVGQSVALEAFPDVAIAVSDVVE
jgi:Uma2 family endonuclease